jgi:hypothetical protein
MTNRDVPLSLDKEIFLSRCPFVPGQTPLSWDVTGQNHLPKKATNRKKPALKQKKDVLKQEKNVLNQERKL